MSRINPNNRPVPNAWRSRAPQDPAAKIALLLVLGGCSSSKFKPHQPFTPKADAAAIALNYEAPFPVLHGLLGTFIEGAFDATAGLNTIPRGLVNMPVAENGIYTDVYNDNRQELFQSWTDNLDDAIDLGGPINIKVFRGFPVQYSGSPAFLYRLGHLDDRLRFVSANMESELRRLLQAIIDDQNSEIPQMATGDLNVIAHFVRSTLFTLSNNHLYKGDNP